MAQAPLSRPLRMHWIGNALMAIASLAAGAMLITSYFMKLSPHAALLHGDPVDRVQAVEELIKLGRRGVPDLVHALKNDNREIRLSALFGLGRIGPQASDAISSVRHALTDPDPAVRSIATGTFWQIHRDPREAVAILLQMLTDSHEDVRQSAVRTLEEIGATNTELLVELIRTQSDQIRTQLWPILRKVSNHGTTPGIANSVRELLDHSNPTIHNEALLSIVSWDQASVDEIRELLKLGATNFEGSPTNDRGSAAVDVALRAILMQGPDAVEFLPEVLERLDQHSPAEVVVFVGTPQPLFQEDSYEIHDQFQILLKILGQMQTAARPAVPLLVRRLDEFHPENRIPVTQALVEIGSDPEFVVSVLVPFLSKQVSEGDFSKTSVKLRERTRQAAGILIRADPEQARQQIALLIPQLENPETGINKSALNILAGFGAALAPADADLLIPLVGHPDREIRHLAIETLSGMGTAASAAIPALLDQLGGDPFTQDPEKNRRIIRTFGQIGTAAKAAVPALLDVVEHANRYVESPVMDLVIVGNGFNNRTTQWSEILRLTAISSLGKIGDDRPQVLSLLNRQMKSPMPDRRVAAAKAMRITSKSSDWVLARLLPLLQDDIAAVRVQALLTVGNLNGQRAAAVKPIEDLLADQNPFVRHAAIITLGKIGPEAASALPLLLEIPYERGHMDSSWFARMTGSINVPSWYDETPEFPRQTWAQSLQEALSSIGRQAD